MAQYLSNPRLKMGLAFIGIVILGIVLFSVYSNTVNIDNSQAAQPVPITIITPAENTKILAGSVAQIQITNPGSTVRRIEFLAGKQGETLELKNSMADLSGKQTLLQEWNVPAEEGIYIVQIRAVWADNTTPTEISRQFQVVNSQAVSLGKPVDTVSSTGTNFSAPAPASEPTKVAEVVSVQAVATLAPTPTQTPIPTYPPPPPLPGVPPGPTQAELPLWTPPICDSAEFIGIYAADTNRRITVNEPDNVAAKAVGGTSVHRAWRLRNTGTCTWGPGYELAFYGGRAMGSGGVAFGTAFPTEPIRRNALVDTNRLILPEGTPNQVAILELLLNLPTTPGIHQSYWRMRNPQGVYFGPILGVTFEIVRECSFGIYGAPVINRFEILGYGNVYQPSTPREVQAVLGQTVTLDWDILNVTNFDIALEDPTGNVSALSNTVVRGRAQFITNKLGDYVITMYADNGPCAAEPVQVRVKVVPPQGVNQFDLRLILSAQSAAANSNNKKIEASSTLNAGDVTILWQHPDKNANNFTLITQLYRRSFTLQCPVIDSIFGWKGYCSKGWGAWTAVSGTKKVVDVGSSGGASGTATVSNIESSLCPNSFDSTSTEYGLKYVLRAEANGAAASPEFSNAVDAKCNNRGTTDSLPLEMQNAGFDPGSN